MEEIALGIDIMECLRAGVTDLRLPGTPMVGLENERKAGPSSTAVMSVIGPIQVDLFVAAVNAIAVKRVELQLPEQVDVETKYVLAQRSEEHTSELQSLMRISYSVFCLQKKKKQAQ